MTFVRANGIRTMSVAGLKAGVAIFALCAPSLLAAQSNPGAPAPQAPAKPVQVEASPPADDGVIVVSGIRQSLEDALEIRRKADVVLDGISADDIGSTPDLNLGEALARVPGVQINREEGRRDATISVRGLPGNFSKTTIQGQSIASTSRGITFNAGNPFGIYDSSIFSGANVVKSFTGDTPSGGLAAVVDLRIKSALDRKDGAVLRAEVNYEESTEAFVPAYFGSISKRLTDSFAVYATAAYTKLDFRREAISVNGYDQFNPTQIARFAAGTLATGDGTVESIGLRGPNEAFNIAPVGDNGLNNSVIFAANPRQFLQRDKGFRVSAAAGFAYEMSDNLTFRVDGIYTRRDLKDSTQDNLNTDITNGNIAATTPGTVSSANQTLVTPLSNPVFIGTFDFNEDGIEENVYNTPSVYGSDALLSYANRFFPALEESFAVYPQINFENDDWRLDVIGTYSEAVGIEQLLNLDFRPRQRAGATNDRNNNGIDDLGTGNSVLINNGLGDINSILFRATIDPRLLTFVPSPIGTTGGGVTFPGTAQGDARVNVGITPELNANSVTGAPAAFNSPLSLLVQGFNSQVNRDLKAIDVDLARKFENSIVTEIAVGGYYSDESSVRRRLELGGLGTNVVGLTQPGVAENLFLVGLDNSFSQGAPFLNGAVPGAEVANFITLNIPLIRETLLSGDPRSLNGAIFAPTAANIQAAFPELLPASAATITVAELLAVAPEVPNSGGFLLRTDNGSLRGANIRNNFTSERKNLELYGMVKFDLTEYSDHPLRGNFGLRYIKTDLSGVGQSVALDLIDRINSLRAASNTPLLELRDGARTPAPGAASFERLLPSANFIYEITPNLVARAAYYHTFEATDLAEFVPTPSFIEEISPGGDPDDLGIDTGVDPNNPTGPQIQLPSTVVSLSSLDVKPRSSKGLDIGLSWYNRPGSVIAVGFFKKTLENDITVVSNFCPVGEDVTFLGQTFNDLQQQGNTCRFVNEDGNLQRIRISFAANNPDDVTVTGFEAQIQQNLDFLPGPLKHTGFIANATRVKSSGPNNITLTRVAELTYNLVGYYDDKTFQARLAWNHQSEIELPNGGSFGGGARRVAPRGQLDFSGAVRPLKNLEFRFEVFNITESPRREYLQDERLFRNYQFDGRTYGLSASYKF